jgi:hypothetical protein
LASSEGQAALADVENFLDVTQMQTFNVEQVEVL